MKLKEDVNEQALLTVACTCNGEVILTTANGDRINLKSRLCQYIFALICKNRELMSNARVLCTDENDYTLLSDFLEGE